MRTAAISIAVAGASGSAGGSMPISRNICGVMPKFDTRSGWKPVSAFSAFSILISKFAIIIVPGLATFQPMSAGLVSEGMRLPIRVLIADDHAMMRSGIKRILQPGEFVCEIEAGTGAEVLQQFRTLKGAIDVAILDYDLPDYHAISLI